MEHDTSIEPIPEPQGFGPTSVQNAANCMQMAEAALGKPAFSRYKRIEAAWLALAEEQHWLDGERSPIGPVEKVVKGK